jgi:hypothetical protein
MHLSFHLMQSAIEALYLCSGQTMRRDGASQSINSNRIGFQGGARILLIKSLK